MKSIKNTITLLTLIFSVVLYSQKANLKIEKKLSDDYLDYVISDDGYICIVQKFKTLKIYEPTNFKLVKEHEFKYNVEIDYVSDDASLIRLKRLKTTGSKFFNRLSGKSKKIKNYYNLIDFEKLEGFNKLGQVEALEKELNTKGRINNGSFYTNSKQITISYGKRRNKKINNKNYYILTTDLKTNKTTYKEFTIDDELLLPASKSYAYKYKLNNSLRKKVLYVTDHDEDGFTLMTRTYKDYAKKSKEPKTQITQLLNFDFEGNLLNNNLLNNKIGSKMEYVDIDSRSFPVSSYDVTYTTYTTPNGGTHTELKFSKNEISLGYYFNPKNTSDFYTYSLLKGVKSKYGSQILVSKFDENGHQKWSKNIIVSEKKAKFKTTGYRSDLSLSKYKNTLSISISNNKDDVFKSYHVNTENGEISQPHDFDKIKYDSGFMNYNKYFSNSIKVKSISKKHTFSEQTLRFYFLNEEFKKFIDQYNSKKSYDFSTYETKDQIILMASRKRELNFYKF